MGRVRFLGPEDLRFFRSEGSSGGEGVKKPSGIHASTNATFAERCADCTKLGAFRPMRNLVAMQICKLVHPSGHDKSFFDRRSAILTVMEVKLQGLPLMVVIAVLSISPQQCA